MKTTFLKAYAGFFALLSMAVLLMAAVPVITDIAATGRGFKGGILVSKTLASPTTNVVTNILAGAATIDFASATTTCADSSGITVTGAQTGDRCSAAPPAAVATGNGTFSCYVSAADTVKVHFCPAGTAFDPASGTYGVTVISHQ